MVEPQSIGGVVGQVRPSGLASSTYCCLAKTLVETSLSV